MVNLQENLRENSRENLRENSRENSRENPQKLFKLLLKLKHSFWHFFSPEYKAPFWRLLELVGIPLLVFGGGIFFETRINEKQQEIQENIHEKQQEIQEKIHEQQQKIQEQQSQQQALENYIESMKKILIGEEYHNGLSELKIPEEDEKNEKNEILLDELSSIARARTVTVLQSINDKKRRKLLIDFLRDAKVGFIERKAELDSPEVLGKIQSPKAVLLRGIGLSEADLSGADLGLAILNEADLSGADLSGATLSSAILQKVRLFKTKLSKAFLIATDLRGADLRGADLRGADLRGANLRGANLEGAENLTYEQIKLTCNWAEALYKAELNHEKRTWEAIEPDNTNFIKNLKKDTSSNPTEEPPDCSLWEHPEYLNQS